MAAAVNTLPYDKYLHKLGNLAADGNAIVDVRLGFFIRTAIK